MGRTRIGRLIAMGVIGGGASVTAWEAAVAALPAAPVLWLKMRETSGAVAVNSGSGGAALNCSIAGTTTLAQAGKLGANEAYLLDGATSLLSTANNAALAGLLEWEYVFLVKPSSAGEAGLGRFFIWGTGTNEPVLTFKNLATRLTATVYDTTPTAVTLSGTTNLSTAAYSLLFLSYSNSGDRKLHLYFGISGAVNEDAAGASAAMTGTYKTPTSGLSLFNSPGADRTFAGLADEVMIFGAPLTAPQRLALVVAAGV